MRAAFDDPQIRAHPLPGFSVDTDRRWERLTAMGTVQHQRFLSHMVLKPSERQRASTPPKGSRAAAMALCWGICDRSLLG